MKKSFITSGPGPRPGGHVFDESHYFEQYWRKDCVELFQIDLVVFDKIIFNSIEKNRPAPCSEIFLQS